MATVQFDLGELLNKLDNELDKKVSGQELTGRGILVGSVVAVIAWIVRLFTT